MLKIVIDTNLVISATISSKGHPARIIQAWLDGFFELIVSPPLIEEMRRVLYTDKVKKYRYLSDKEINALLTKITKTKGFVKPKIILNVIKDDPPDNRILEAAITGKADFIVSGDGKHLLPIKEYQGIKIIPPAEFVEVLSK